MKKVIFLIPIISLIRILELCGQQVADYKTLNYDLLKEGEANLRKLSYFDIGWLYSHSEEEITNAWQIDGQPTGSDGYLEVTLWAPDPNGFYNLPIGKMRKDVNGLDFPLVGMYSEDGHGDGYYSAFGNHIKRLAHFARTWHMLCAEHPDGDVVGSLKMGAIGASVAAAAVGTIWTVKKFQNLVYGYMKKNDIPLNWGEEEMAAGDIEMTEITLDGTGAVATEATIGGEEGATILTEVGTSIALGPETLGVSVVVGGIIAVGTAVAYYGITRREDEEAKFRYFKQEYNEQTQKFLEYYKFRSGSAGETFHVLGGEECGIPVPFGEVVIEIEGRNFDVNSITIPGISKPSTKVELFLPWADDSLPMYMMELTTEDGVPTTPMYGWYYPKGFQGPSGQMKPTYTIPRKEIGAAEMTVFPINLFTVPSSTTLSVSNFSVHNENKDLLVLSDPKLFHSSGLSEYDFLDLGNIMFGGEIYSVTGSGLDELYRYNLYRVFPRDNNPITYSINEFGPFVLVNEEITNVNFETSSSIKTQGKGFVSEVLNADNNLLANLQVSLPGTSIPSYLYGKDILNFEGSDNTILTIFRPKPEASLYAIVNEDHVTEIGERLVLEWGGVMKISDR